MKKLLTPLLAASLILTACRRSESTASTAPAPAKPAESAAAATSAAAPAAQSALVAKVKGRWIRPDGGYLLQIGDVGADGRAEAGYFNPNPINVAWATVKEEGGKIRVQVELRDRNYPGCLYNMTYVPEKEQLSGTYFQAQMQETYSVVFVRE